MKIELARLPPGSSKELLKRGSSFKAHANGHSLFQVWLTVIHNDFWVDNSPFSGAYRFQVCGFERAFITLSKFAICCLRAVVVAEKRPCLSAFLFPFGAAGDVPRCMRRRPFDMSSTLYGESESGCLGTVRKGTKRQWTGLREVTNARQCMKHSVKPSGRNRSLLPTMLAMTVVAILALVAMLLLSDFPGEPEGTTNKTEAPPEDVRR